MDTNELIASVVGSVAWPASIFATALIFRKQLEKLLPLLRIKYKDVDVSFLLAEAEKEAAQLPQGDEETAAAPTEEEDSKFVRIAKLSPTAAIMEVRREVESAVQSLHIFLKGTSAYGSRVLLKQRIISPQTLSLLDDLRLIANKVSHDAHGEVTFDDAIRYRELANKALSQLQLAHSTQETLLSLGNPDNGPPHG